MIKIKVENETYLEAKQTTHIIIIRIITLRTRGCGPKEKVEERERERG